MKDNAAAGKTEVKQEWDELYGNIPLELLPWYSPRPLPALVRLLNKEQLGHGRCLDIGCGAGTNSLYLAAKGFIVTGLDISTEAVRLAKRKVESSPSRVSFVIGDAAALSFKEASFDFIFDRGCFHHIPAAERKTFIEGLHRVLKESGRYLLICFSDKNPPRENTFSRKDIINYFSPYFFICWTKPSVFKEWRRNERFFYTAFMTNRKTEIRQSA